MTRADSFGFLGKVAAVIGAGSGIGEAVAVGLADRGARVACFDLNGPAVERVAERCGGAAGALDVRSATAVEAAIDSLAAREGQLDIVICTPGVNVRKPLLGYSEEEFDRVVSVNLKGGFHVLRGAGRVMVKQGRGSIVLFSSIRSHVVEPGQSVYAATKAGIVQLVRTAAAEFGPRGVRVNAVAPGVVETPLTEPIKAASDWYQAYAQKTVLGRWARVEEIVGPTLFLASDAASYVTGSVLFVDGGWTAADGRFQPPGM